MATSPACNLGSGGNALGFGTFHVSIKVMKLLAATALALATMASAGAQAPAAPVRARVTGTVISVDVAGGRIAIRTDKGDLATVTTTEKSFLRRLPPGETDTKKAMPIGLGDIGAGDRVVAIGQAGSDAALFEAHTVLCVDQGRRGASAREGAGRLAEARDDGNRHRGERGGEDHRHQGRARPVHGANGGGHRTASLCDGFGEAGRRQAGNAGRDPRGRRAACAGQ